MKRLFLFFIFFWVSIVGFSQSEIEHGVLISPTRLFSGRLNTKYEKITKSHFTYGGRFEMNVTNAPFDKHIWIAPFGRFYVFSNEANGFYTEVSAFYRIRYAKNDDKYSTYDYYKSNGGARLLVGGQFWTGKKSNIPFDIGIGLNLDLQNIKNNDNPDVLSTTSSIIGPLSMFCFRIQTGIGF
jgi:hypothetical protein